MPVGFYRAFCLSRLQTATTPITPVFQWLQSSAYGPCVYHTSALCLAKQLPPRKVIPERDIQEAFVKGSGPGGQKINKTSSAVQLKHIPSGIVVKSQATRSRELNRKIARELLAEKLDVMENGEESRVAIKTKDAARKRASKLKKSRRKYRKLEEEKVETSTHALNSQVEAGANSRTNGASP